MKDNQVNQMAENIINSVARDIQPIVKDIHSLPPVSEGYYVEYYSRLLSKERSIIRIKMVCLAIIKAGGNMTGSLHAAELAIETISSEDEIEQEERDRLDLLSMLN